MTQLVQNLHNSPYMTFFRQVPAYQKVVPIFRSYCRRKPSFSASSAKSFGAPSLEIKRSSDSSSLELEQKNKDAMSRIRKLFDDVDISVSTYDTAWVAMVPDESGASPLFPECVDWVVNNQLEDGSWSLPHHAPHLMKDVLSSTLACVLALKKWGMADDQVLKGIGFIEANFTTVCADEHLVSPLGFDIIFSSMLQYARDLGLNLQLDTNTLSDLLHKRDFAFKSFNESNSEESKEYLAYISEGMLTSHDWDMAMKFQKKNGSILNSPSATAAAAIHLQNQECINYLYSVVEKFGSLVPAVYPLDIYQRLCLVDNLERLGISRHFKGEIQNVLDATYRYWKKADEEISTEASTCAIAFQLLRNHGYDVSADPLTKFVPDDYLDSSFGGYWMNLRTMLELYRASELIIDQNEPALENLFIWSKNFLNDQISSGCNFKKFNCQLNNEVENILKLPSHANLERVAHKKFIEQFDLKNTRVLKTSFSSSTFSNKYIRSLAIKDFNDCQTLHREELKHIQSWFKENRFDELKFTRDVSAYAYFSAATTICSPELSDARLLFAKHSVLITLIDDFFDVGGSIEELKHFIDLVEKWDVKACNSLCSGYVQILFSALYNTIIDTGIKAFKWQERDITSHIAELWLECLYTELKEVEWAKKLSAPTSLDEYMAISHVSFGYEPILVSASYLIGPKLSEEVARSPEMRLLHKLAATCGRLLNDIQGFQRELKNGKINYFSMRVSQGKEGEHDVTKEDVIAEMRSLNDQSRRELLKLVLQENGSVVPRACKDLYWDASQIVHLFYDTDDGYRTQGMHKLVKSIIHEPLIESCL